MFSRCFIESYAFLFEEIFSDLRKTIYRFKFSVLGDYESIMSESCIISKFFERPIRDIIGFGITEFLELG